MAEILKFYPESVLLFCAWIIFFRKLTLLSNSTEDNFDERCLLEDMKTSNDASTSDTRISHEEMELNSLNNEL